MLGAAAWHPAPPARQAWGHPMSPAADSPSPLETANSRRRISAPSPCGTLVVRVGDTHAAHPASPLPRCPHPDRQREPLAGVGTPLPTVSGCCSRAEVLCFVLVSLSEPTKRKFPHGKPLIFECARMCWKPSRWKIPNQLHGTLTSPVNPLT